MQLTRGNDLRDDVRTALRLRCGARMVLALTFLIAKPLCSWTSLLISISIAPASVEQPDFGFLHGGRGKVQHVYFDSLEECIELKDYYLRRPPGIEPSRETDPGRGTTGSPVAKCF